MASTAQVSVQNVSFRLEYIRITRAAKIAVQHAVHKETWGQDTAIILETKKGTRYTAVAAPNQCLV